MRFSPSNRFKFTYRNIVDETFHYGADIHFIKEKLYEYNRNNVAVYDYMVLPDKCRQNGSSVLFRIIKPRYQIAYKTDNGRIYYSEKVYRAIYLAKDACDLLNKKETGSREYYVETISYLDEEI